MRIWYYSSMEHDFLLYVAGLIDSDGHIGLTRFLNHKTGGWGYVETVIVAQVDNRALTEIHKHFGGHLSQRKSPSTRWTPCWELKFTYEKAHQFCKTLLPLLRVKHKQAEMLLEYRQTVGSHITVDPLLLEERAHLHEAIKFLNQPTTFFSRQPRPEYNPEVDFPYLAGIVDGDGSILVGCKQPSAKQKRTTLMYYEIVSVVQCHDEIPRIFQHYFNGTLFQRKMNPTTGTILWHWSAERRKAVACLKLLLPHLRIKREQAELVLQLNKFNLPTLHNRVHPDVLRHRKEIWKRVKELKGKAAK